MVVGLESIGFKVIAVIADNNAINRKAMCKFVPPPKSNQIKSNKLINCIPNYQLYTLSLFELNSTLFSFRHSSFFKMCSE